MNIQIKIGIIKTKNILNIMIQILIKILFTVLLGIGIFTSINPIESQHISLSSIISIVMGAVLVVFIWDIF